MKNIRVVLIALAVAWMALASTHAEYVEASESSAIIACVDGFSEVNTLWNNIVDYLCPYCFLIPDISFEARNGYLREHLYDIPVLAGGNEIVSFGWSGVIDIDYPYDSLLVWEVQEFLRLNYDKAKSEGKKFIVIAHSWGTVLAWTALYFESAGSEPIIPDLVIWLSTPFGTDQAHEPPLYLVAETAVATLATTYMYYALPNLNACGDCSYPAPNKLYNFWAWQDVVSGPLVNSNFGHNLTEEIQVDQDDQVYGQEFRNKETTVPMHAYTSLAPTDLTNRDDKLRERVKNLIFNEIADPPSSLHIDGYEDSALLLSWLPPNLVAGLSHYVVYYKSDDMSEFEHVNTESADAEYLVTGLSNGREYLFYVSAVYADGCEGPKSNEIYGTPQSGVTPPINVEPSIQILSPVNQNEPTDWDGYTIRWIDSDPDDNASISLWYDTDNNYANGVSGVIGATMEDSADSYYWNTSGIATGAYYICAKIYDGVNDEVVRYSPGTVYVTHPATRNDFELAPKSDWQWDDDFSGNDQAYINGIPEGNETLDLIVPLRNKSGTNYKFIHATLSSSAGAVDFSQGDNYVNYGNINAGVTLTPDDDFCFRISTAFYTGTPFLLTLAFEDESGNNYVQQLSFTHDFPAQGTLAPMLTAGAVQIDDSGASGDGDGVFESGERINFWVPLTNNGTADCVNPTGIITQLTTWGSNVFSDMNNVYPDVPVGVTVNNTYDYDTYAAPKNFSGAINATMRVWYGPDEDKYQDVSFTINVTGAPYMWLSPRTYDFGIVSAGTNVVIPATINNDGAADLTISSIASNDADTTISGAPGASFSVAPGASQAINITIDTTGESNGILSRQLTVTSSNAYEDKIQYIQITGMIGSGGGEQALISGPGNQDSPHINGNKLIYRDDVSGHIHIYMKDLDSGAVTQLTTDDSINYWTPRIYQNYVVWVQRPTSGSTTDNEIYLLDINNIGGAGNPVRITSDAYIDSHPRIWGDYVIWAKTTITEPSYRADVYLYQISSGNTYQLTNTSDKSESSPEIHDTYAAWYDSYDVVYRCPLSTRTPAQVGTLNYVEDLEVYGNRLIWIDEGDDGYDVFSYQGSMPATNLTNDEGVRDEYEVTVYGNEVIYLADDDRLYRVTIGGSGPEVFVSEVSIKEDIFLYDQLLVWADYRNGNSDIYMKSLSTNNLSIKGENITFSPDNPQEGQAININAVIQNQGESALADILVRFYSGDPDSGGTQIGSDSTITSLGASSSVTLQQPWTVPTGQTHDIFVVVDPDGSIQENNESDNKASAVISANDSDVNGPSITNIVAEEYNGDGDGLIEDNEQIRISWSATDTSGIDSTSCDIDGNSYSASGTYYVLVGPLGVGSYSFDINATDADDTPSSTTESSSLQVYSHAPVVTNVSPGDGASGVSVRPIITAEFSSDLDISSITASSVLLKDSVGVSVTANLSYISANNEVTIEPSSNLTNSETYTVTLKSGAGGLLDQNGNDLDADYSWSFTVEPDTVTPTAVITSPSQLSFVSGVLNIVGSAWDSNFDFYKLQYGVGSTPSSWVDITGELSTPVTNNTLGSWDTSQVADGSYAIRLVVEDQEPASNQTVASVVVNVDNTSPTATVSGEPASLTMLTHASLSVGGMGVVAYKFKLDALSWSEAASVSTAINLTGLQDGQHVVYVLGCDAAGNWQTTPTVSKSWTVDATPPVVTITSQTTTETSPGLSGTVNDNDAQIYVSVGDQQFMVATNNENGTWDLSAGTINALPPGVYDVSVVAIDPAGNIANDSTSGELIILSEQCSLSLSQTGNGKLYVGGVEVTTPFNQTYDDGTILTISAVPDEGWEFSNWSGSFTGSENPISVTMDAAKSINCVFSELTILDLGAHIEISHANRGNLVVDLGIGDPDSPTWVTRVWDKDDTSAENLILDVDISAAQSYLPPNATNKWYLKVYDDASGDVGNVISFSILADGQTYYSADVPVQIHDMATAFAFIPSEAGGDATGALLLLLK